MAVADMTVEMAGRDAQRSVVLVEFLVARGLAGSLEPDELIVRVERCTQAGCTDVGYTRQALTSGQFVVSGSGARLRTTWLGAPLDLRFSHRPRIPDYSGNVSLSVGSPKYLVENFTQRAVEGRARLLGRAKDCPVDNLGGLITGEAGQREPVPGLDATATLMALPEFRGRVACVPGGTLTPGA